MSPAEQTEVFANIDSLPVEDQKEIIEAIQDLPVEDQQEIAESYTDFHEAVDALVKEHEADILNEYPQIPHDVADDLALLSV